MTASGIAFLAGSAGIAAFSWRFSIRAGRYHGVARFFAFESIWALFLLNRPFWFARPASPLQLASWILLLASLGLAVPSAVQLVRRGRPQGQIENTTRLVTDGIYRYLRHPLYASLLYLGLGIWLKRITPATTALAAADAIAILLTARIEEGEMRARFGDAYEDYRRRSKRFLPFVF